MRASPSNDDNKNCQVANHHENLIIPTYHPDPVSSVPGVFHISGPNIPTNIQALSHVSNQEATSIHANNDVPGTVVLDTDTESEDFIQGVIVTPNGERNSHIKITFFSLQILAFSVITAITIITAFIVTEPQLSSNSGHASIQPSLSPTVTFSPTTTIDYEAYLRDIVSNISDEDVLLNTSSIQYSVFWRIVERLPEYESQSILFVNDTEAIFERYVMGVVGYSASIRMKQVSGLENLPYYGKTCHVPYVVCNDEEKIVKLVMQNEWMGTRGRGIIATEMGALKSLTHLILTRSALQGTIPSEIGKLTNLQYLDMNSNKLTGKIPSEIGKLHNMNMMFLQSNNLTNNIPSEIGNLSRLVYMDLSLNMLNGTVPTELNMLNELKGLKIHGNLFTGSVNFVCQKNMTNSSLEFELDFGVGGVVQKTLDLGISVDCMSGLRMSECACCVC